MYESNPNLIFFLGRSILIIPNFYNLFISLINIKKKKNIAYFYALKFIHIAQFHFFNGY